MDYYDEDNGLIDIDCTVEAIREAWKIVPHMELSEMIDVVAQAPLCELSNAEFIHELNEFILQNR